MDREYSFEIHTRRSLHDRRILIRRYERVKRTIKSGKNIGVAKQVQGQTVEVVPHPKCNGLWQFEFKSEKWIASDYAFKN